MKSRIKSLNIKDMKNILFLIVITFMINGCTTYVFTSRTLPPKLVLDKQPAKIAFGSQFEYQLNPGIKDKHENAYQIGIEEFGKTLSEFKPSNNQKVIFLNDTTNHTFLSIHSGDSLQINTQITGVCNRYNTDYYLVLDSVYFYFDWEVNREEFDDGSVSKTKDFYLMGNYYLTLFNHDGTVMEKTLLEKSIHYASRPTLGALITIKPNLDNAKEKIRKLSNEAGQEYFSMFYPSFESDIMVELYTGKVFKESNALIRSGKYDEAIPLLQDMTKTLSPKLAEKAKHNLDAAFELKQNGANKFPNLINY